MAAASKRSHLLRQADVSKKLARRPLRFPFSFPPAVHPARPQPFRNQNCPDLKLYGGMYSAL